MTETQLRHCIESGINATLALCCCLEKVVSEDPLAKWLDNVKHIDGLISAKHVTFDALTKKSRKTLRCTNPLAELSRRANTNNNTNTANCTTLPKITSVK